jgi:hypothetical protein
LRCQERIPPGVGIGWRFQTAAADALPATGGQLFATLDKAFPSGVALYRLDIGRLIENRTTAAVLSVPAVVYVFIGAVFP